MYIPLSRASQRLKAPGGSLPHTTIKTSYGFNILPAPPRRKAFLRSTRTRHKHGAAASLSGRASRPLAGRSVIAAARGSATCAATGAGGERQPGRDACRVCQLEVLGAARVRVWAAASGMVRSRVMGGDRVGRRLGGAYAPLWTSLNLPIRAGPRGRRPIAGTWPVWDASWRYRYLKEPGRTHS